MLSQITLDSQFQHLSSFNQSQISLEHSYFDHRSHSTILPGLFDRPPSTTMQILNIIAALLASSAIVVAAPSAVEKRATCPPDYDRCGVWDIKLFLPWKYI